MATVLVVLDAVDVAMTEAAVGAGLSTVLLLSVLHLTRTRAAPLRHTPVIPILVCLMTGTHLFYWTTAMPSSSGAAASPNPHLAPSYLPPTEHSPEKIRTATSTGT